MTSLTEGGGILIDGSASELAFKAGQVLQRELTARAIALAEHQADTQQNVVVRPDHIIGSLNASLLDTIRARLGADSHGDPREERRVSA